MIPDYQSIMLPLLKLVSDKQEHKFRDIIEELAKQFKLTDDERKELLPRVDSQSSIIGWVGLELILKRLVFSKKKRSVKRRPVADASVPANFIKSLSSP